MLTYDLRSGGQPKYYRLYTCIREDILRAELPPGQKLPSKRALAEHLHISLATVSGAYEQLVDEAIRSRAKVEVIKMKAVMAMQKKIEESVAVDKFSMKRFLRKQEQHDRKRM